MRLMDVLKYFVICIGLFVSLSFVVLVLIYAERKSLARIQQRLGPPRVGFKGILQPVADALKLISKEDVLPSLGFANRCICASFYGLGHDSYSERCSGKQS